MDLDKFRLDGRVAFVTGGASGIGYRIADALAAGAGRIDISVNDAGIARSETAAEEVADEHWLNAVDVNLNDR